MADRCCILCKEEFTQENPPVKVHEKGLRTLVRISKERGFHDLHK